MRSRLFLLPILLIGASVDASASSDVVPGRLIVKYRPSVDACVHCLVAHGTPFASITGRSSLDDVHQSLGVRAAHPLFFDHHTQSGGRAAAWALRMDAVRATSSLRAARARSADTPGG
jgi:hypothetical protein